MVDAPATTDSDGADGKIRRRNINSRHVSRPADHEQTWARSEEKALGRKILLNRRLGEEDMARGLW